MLTIDVFGTPAPQGSKRFVGVKAGRGIMIESSKAVKPWREAVKFAAMEAMRQAGLIGNPFEGPLVLDIYFVLARPKSAPKSRTHPDRKPDLSKLVRSTEDALTDAGVWCDDAQVVSMTVSKGFPALETIPTPGAIIQITRAR